MVNNPEISNISNHFIPFIIYNPLIAILVISFLTKLKSIKAVSYISLVLNLIICVHIFLNFNTNSIKPQFVVLSHWIVFLNLDFAIGITGLSLLFIASISIIIFLSLIYERTDFTFKKKTILILFICSSANGFFLSLNTILMFFFLIVFIISFYLYITYFEDNNRGKNIFIVLLSSSLFFLSSVIIIYSNSGSFYLPNVEILKNISPEVGMWVFVLMIISIVMIFSIFPFHVISIQQKDSESIFTNIVISSIVLKIAIFNYIKFCMPFKFNDNFLYVLIVLSLLTFLYSSIIAFTRNSINKLFSYIMVSHAAIAFTGALFFINDGITGSILHIINMGFIIPGLFFCYGFMFRRTDSSMIDDNRAISIEMPVFSIFVIFFSLALIGFPMTGTFISEFLIISGGLKKSTIFGTLIIFGLIFTALYVINYTRKMIWGDSDINILNLKKISNKDLKFDELLILLILAIIIIFNGLFPKLLMDIMNSDLNNILKLKL